MQIFVEFDRNVCIRFVFDDEIFARKFENTYGAVSPSRSTSPLVRYSIRVCSSGAPGYVVSFEGGEFVECSSQATALGVIDSYVEALLHVAPYEGVCAVHAATFALNAGGVALVGTSGSGKTTLGVCCACSGASWVGDEFGFLDMEKNVCWHAHYPINLKKDTVKILRLREDTTSLSVISPWGTPSVMVAPEVLSKEKIEAEEGDASVVRKFLCSSQGARYPLKFLIFPEYTPRTFGTSIRAVSLVDLPMHLLPSIQGVSSQDTLFRELLHCISKHGVKLYSMKYSDAWDASKRLIEVISCGLL